MSPGPTAWADTSGWKLSEVLRIEGTQGDSTVINEPQSLGLDGEGRVYVADQKPAVIKVFDPAGKLVRTIGREGAGPGEFQSAFIAIHGANLVVHDPRQSRTSVFDTSGTFLKSWNSRCCYWQPIFVDRDGLAYIPGMSPPDSGPTYIRYAMHGATRDTLYLPKLPDQPEKSWTFSSKQMMMSMGIPLVPEQQLRVNPAGGFLVGMGDRYEIRETRRGRDTTRVFGRAWLATTSVGPPPSGDRGQHDQAGHRIRRGSSGAEHGQAGRCAQFSARLHRHRSGRAGIPLGDDRPGDDTTHTWFDVFDTTGVYLGQVAGPPGLVSWRISWKDDAMLAFIEDADGEPAVVKYTIVR